MTKLLAELCSEFRVPGASLAYWHDGEIHQEAAGVLNLATGVEVTPGSIFQIGSITKVWTTAQIMLLIEQGRLTLDTPVARLLDGLCPGVAVRHLLTHTCGVDGDFFHDTGRGDDCLARYAEAVRELAPAHPAGAAHSYSNAGFVLAGRIVEVLTGQVWDDALRSMLIEPLGLTHTWTLPEDVIRFRAATGHLGEPGEPQRPTPTWGIMRSIGPAGLICATAADVVRFGRSFLDSPLLSAASVEAMATPQVELPYGSFGSHWGLGWILDEWDGVPVWSHGGNTIGQSAMLWVLPGSGVTVAALANGGDTAGLFRALAARLFPELTGVSPRPLPQPPADPPAWSGEHDGVHERTSARITVTPGRLRYENTGSFADLDEPMHYTLVPVGEGRYLARRDGEELWSGVVCTTFPDGSPYLYFGGRATPKTR
ncbi:serine hydrolase domain-containing protein [Nonomuraea sp. NPDC050310]|uniref:serine hydrolase domain-containing protein n=1 Tax=Nonomuraea sp. NPDC050310 TaxID=3154935 RepID=UPI0033F6885F